MPAQSRRMVLLEQKFNMGIEEQQEGNSKCKSKEKKTQVVRWENIKLILNYKIQLND